LLRLKYRYETFGNRNAVKTLFQVKGRVNEFWKRFPYNSSFNSTQSWLERFVPFYNLWRS